MFASIKLSISKNLLCSAGVVLAVALSVSAQGVGSSRGLNSGEGSNTIQGRVFYPAGEPNKSIKLRLESVEASGMSTVTDQDGVFRFNGLPAGSYTVVVEGGKDYENTREPVTIDTAGRGHIVQVTIQLRPKVDAANPAFAGVPQNALNAFQKGSAAAQKGKSEEAVQFLTAAVTAYPNFSLALSELGSQYLKLFKWAKAAETFEALLKLKPTDGGAQLNLGIALYNEGTDLLGQKKFDDAEKRFNGAETHLREAVRLKVPGPSPHYYLGLMLIKFKAYEEAQKELELAISNGGENLALAHKYLGGVYMSTHKNKEAADELEKYLKLQPKAPDADRIKTSINELRSKP
jgi:Flp pilus assembly protein TadD